MPLARIISRNLEHSDELARDLQSRGFQVETSAPGESLKGTVDLEITLNECAAEEAARLASEVQSEKDMRVFVSPRALAGKIRSIEMFVLSPKPAAAFVAEPKVAAAPEVQPEVQLAEVQTEAQPERREPDVRELVRGITEKVVIMPVAASPDVPSISAPVTAIGLETNPAVVEAGSIVAESGPPENQPVLLEEPAESEVVPHGMIWQAVAAKSEPKHEPNPEPRIVVSDEPAATIVVAGEDAAGREQIEFEPEAMPSQPRLAASQHLAVTQHQPPKTHQVWRIPSTAKMDTDKRFWTAAAFAGLAAVLALAVVSLVHRSSPLPAQAAASVKASTTQVPFHAAPVPANPDAGNAQLNASAQSKATPEEPTKVPQADKSTKPSASIPVREARLSKSSPPIKLAAKTTRESRPKPRHHRDDGYVAEDKVVHVDDGATR
jgi:hypothetical protein